MKQHSVKQPLESAQKPGDAKKFANFNRALAAKGNPPAEAAFVRDEVYEASPGVRQALAAIDARTPAILIAGRAGTGKTRLVQYIKSRPGGELQVTVAPTGIAALNARAQTIHSFFHLEHAVLDAKNLSKGGKFGSLYRRVKRLVIDEISMVRADVIDAVDARLRQVRGDKRPFGGVQIVMVGDFLQLPPVVQEQDWPMLEGLGYEAPYAFNAHALQSLPVETVTLDRVWRQDEQDFVDILGRIRSREGIVEALERLNARCVGPHRDGVKPLLLTTRRLFCPADLTGRASVSLRLTDVLSVTLRKHWVGFSTIVVETADRRQAAFAAHINGPLVRSDIAASVDAAHGTSAPNPPAVKAAPAGDRYQQLREISALKESGVLTEAEFEKEKARILEQP